MIKNFFEALIGGQNNKFYNEVQCLKKLRNQLITCTYYNAIKFIIQKICLDILKEYPNLDTSILAFIQNNQPRRFIQIGGMFNYTYKQKKHTIKVYMMFNQHFPNRAPYMRIVNYERKQINPYYQPLISPNDKLSYIMNQKIISLSKWTTGNSCVNALKQLKYLLETYNFYEEQLENKSNLQKKSNIQSKQIQSYKPIQSKDNMNRSSYYQQSKDETPANHDDYNAKQCKLCFDAQSTMINVSCGHIMMCQKCFNDYRNKSRSDVCQCPICKTRGQYIRFVQPKYA